MKILVIRPDRIGDVVLSTPVLEALRSHYPDSRITFMVQRIAHPVCEGLASVDEVIDYEPFGVHQGIRGLFHLVKAFREGQFDMAIVLHSYSKIALALFLARIPVRIGPVSKLHSFFFYNKGYRQRRSLVEMHETDYSLQLLHKAGVRVASRVFPTRVALSDSVKSEAKDWLEKQGWDGQRKIAIVHPGMGGSALNWPEVYYHQLCRELLRDDFQVIVTGGPSEQSLLQRARDSLGELEEEFQKKLIFYGGKESKPLDFLAGILSNAHVVIAPSTGPLHVAVALGVPVVTFYPPIEVQSALRWGPYLKDESKASVMVPENFCGQKFKCLGEACRYFPCMESLSVSHTLGEVRRQVKHWDQPAARS